MTGGQTNGSMKQYNQYRNAAERRAVSQQGFPGAFMQNGTACRIGAMPQTAPTFPGDVPLAMIYAPESTFTDIFNDAEGLDKGTIFADLFFPFEATCAGGVR